MNQTTQNLIQQSSFILIKKNTVILPEQFITQFWWSISCRPKRLYDHVNNQENYQYIIYVYRKSQSDNGHSLHHKMDYLTDKLDDTFYLRKQPLLANWFMKTSLLFFNIKSSPIYIFCCLRYILRNLKISPLIEVR